MEKIIEKLYYLHKENEPFPYGKVCREKENREWELYHYLYENLLIDERSIFSEYINLKTDRNKEELLASYEFGFKTAIQLITEALKE